MSRELFTAEDRALFGPQLRRHADRVIAADHEPGSIEGILGEAIVACHAERREELGLLLAMTQVLINRGREDMLLSLAMRLVVATSIERN